MVHEYETIINLLKVDLDSVLLYFCQGPGFSFDNFTLVKYLIYRISMPNRVYR